MYRQHALKQDDQRSNTILVGSKQQYSRVSAWRIESDIREPFVSRDQEPAFGLYGSPHVCIFPPAHALLYDGRCIMSMAAQQPCQNSWQVFVYFDEHGSPLKRSTAVSLLDATPRRHMPVPLLCRQRSVGDTAQ